MRYASLFCILCLLLVSATCNRKTLENQLLQKTWLHSYEEDAGDTIAFRPNTYDFPPSRGRTGFMLEKGGTIRQYEIAPTDGLQEILGQWEFNGNQAILVKLQEEEDTLQQYRLEIVSLKDELLKVKRLQLPEPNGNR